MRKLNITEDVLDKLGFSEYWDEHCTWGGRTLSFSNGINFRIIENEEMTDDTDWYSEPIYISNHFYFAGFFALPVLDAGIHFDLFFIHEMYECIEKVYPECLEEFKQKCIDVKMGIYIDEFINERNSKINV